MDDELTIKTLYVDTVYVKHLNIVTEPVKAPVTDPAKVETQAITDDDIKKATKRGRFFGDPILVIE